MTSDDEWMEFRVEARQGYVFIWQKGRAPDAANIEAMQRAIEKGMAEAGTRDCLFDNRDTIQPDQLVRAAMWTWLTENVRRAALIQAEAKNIARAERTGERNRIAVRAFDNEADAEAWLLGKTAE